MGTTSIHMSNLHKLESAINILSSLELDKEEGIVLADKKEAESLVEKLQKIKHKLKYKDYSPEDFLQLALTKEIFEVGYDGMEHEILSKCSLSFLQTCFNNAAKKKCFFMKDYNHLRLHLASPEDLEEGIYEVFVIKV